MFYKFLMIVLMGVISPLSFSKSKVEVIAHRGSSGVAPENTIAAIKQAIIDKSHYIEIDVQMTKDKKIVAIHDLTVDRTTNSKGLVKNKSLNELQSLDSGSWFNEKFKNEKIPTLEQVLDELDEDLKLIIEVKNNNNEYPGIEKIITAIVSAHPSKARIIYKSFSKKVLDRFKDLDSIRETLYCTIGPVPFLPLYIDHSLRTGTPLDYDADYYQIHRSFLTKDFIEIAHSKNKKVIGWDIHKLDDIKKANTKGVDIIETDYPKRVLSNFYK
jgi:glycerophosphoryl diester phosphodiesterase